MKDSQYPAPTILGFDPGKEKCGIAIATVHRPPDRTILYHQVIDSTQAIATLQSLCRQHEITQVVLGDRTTSKSWQAQLTAAFPATVAIHLVDERNSTLEARDRYWQMYPPRGLTCLIPQGMRLPPRPVDDIVAILLIERFLDGNQSS